MSKSRLKASGKGKPVAAFVVIVPSPTPNPAVSEYLVRPSFSNNWTKAPPGRIVPLSNEPSAAVTVWFSMSSFVHLTESPTSMFKSGIEYPFSVMDTWWVLLDAHDSAALQFCAVAVMFRVSELFHGCVSQISITPSLSSSASQ